MNKFTKIKLYTFPIFLISFIFILAIPLSSAIEITSCQTLSTAGATYTLQNDILGIVGTCFTIAADNIKLDGNGFTIDGDDSGIDYGVIAGSRDNLTIKNFENITDFNSGIYITNTDNSLITNNTVNSNTVSGIFLYPSSNNNTITNNTVNSNNYGIRFASSSNNNQITNNNLSSNAFGIFFASSSNNNQITNNNLSSNFNGIRIESSSYNQITNNIVNSNGNRAIYIFSSSSNSIITNNTINLNSIGIYLALSSSNIITNNIVNSNTNYGIYLILSTNNNQFLNNKITNSGTQDIFDATGNSRINYLIYNNSFGEIKWANLSDNGFLKDMDLVGNIGLGINLSIGNNTAYLNAGAFTLGSINSSANITLYGMDSFSFTNPAILKDGTQCSDCYNFTALDASTVKFNVTYAGANYSIGVLDSDNDDVSDELDICPNTELPETFELLKNRFGDVDGDGIFEELIGKKKNEGEIVDSEFTLEDTFGCSCAQILEIKSGKNVKESVNGCKKGTIVSFTKHKFSGGILSSLSFAITGFFGDIKDLISGMVTGKLFKL